MGKVTIFHGKITVFHGKTHDISMALVSHDFPHEIHHPHHGPRCIFNVARTQANALTQDSICPGWYSSNG